MTLEGVKIYSEGVGIPHDSETKIRQIVDTIRNLSPSAGVSMRLVKNGRIYEALLWGKADEIPIGVYNRGPSVNHVLDSLYKKVKKTCLKSRRPAASTLRRAEGHSPIDPGQMAMAG